MLLRGFLSFPSRPKIQFVLPSSSKNIKIQRPRRPSARTKNLTKTLFASSFLNQTGWFAALLVSLTTNRGNEKSSSEKNRKMVQRFIINLPRLFQLMEPNPTGKQTSAENQGSQVLFSMDADDRSGAEVVLMRCHLLNGIRRASRSSSREFVFGNKWPNRTQIKRRPFAAWPSVNLIFGPADKKTRYIIIILVTECHIVDKTPDVRSIWRNITMGTLDAKIFIIDRMKKFNNNNNNKFA